MQNAGELADSATLAPMFSEEGGRVRIEHGLHQELRFEDNTSTASGDGGFLSRMRSRVRSSAEADGYRSRILPRGTCCTIRFRKCFRVTGPGFTTGGFRAVVAQKIAGSTWATLSYADGKALAFESPDSAVTVAEAVHGLTQRRAEAVTGVAGWPAGAAREQAGMLPTVGSPRIR